MADSRKSKLFKKYIARMDTIKKDSYASALFDDLKSGKNSYMRIDRLESSSFDMTWIKEIEDCIYDLGEIVANPKQVTKTVSNIVPVELAKKIGAESVVHLASHTQYIKDIDEEGNVVPNKILSLSSEDDIHTYENRFIATLIRRLVLFIEKRYEFVKKFAPLHDEEILFYKTKAIVDGSEVEIETKVKVRSESDTKMADVSNKYIQRILEIRDYVLYFYGSKFMKELKTERDVRNPIVMTNILRKNVKYHKCYELYRFIERYDRLGVSYKVDEDASIFNEDELNELNTLMLTNYLALKARDRSKVTKGKTRVYKPRILTSIDDEKFIYGDLLEGPIEFLRVDQGYQDYLDDKVNEELPAHPTKIEKEYYAEEIEAKAKRKKEKAALEKLERRKKKELTEYERTVQKIIAQREKEERDRIAREAEEARLAEERRIEEVRRALVEEARGHKGEMPEPLEGETPVEEVVEQEIMENENLPEEAEVIEENPVESASNEEITEETPIEEPVSEVVEEVQPVEEENTPEEVVEEPAPVEEVPEVIETPVEEEQPIEETPTEAPASEDDLEAIRAQIIADALNNPEEDVSEPAPNEEVAEEPVQEDVPAEEIQPVELEQAEEPPVEEEQPVIEEPSVEVPPIVDDTPKERHPRFIRVRKHKVKEEPSEESPVEEELAPRVEEEQPVEEESLVVEISQPEEPKERHPRFIRVRKPKKKASKETEETPIEEPIVEEPVQEPVPEEVPVEESPVEESQPVVEEQPIEKEPKPKKKAEEHLEKIPGKFIVKTNQGYYVKPGIYSVYKHDAKVFDDYNEAHKIKNEHGGKVVKL